MEQHRPCNSSNWNYINYSLESSKWRIGPLMVHRHPCNRCNCWQLCIIHRKGSRLCKQRNPHWLKLHSRSCMFSSAMCHLRILSSGNQYSWRMCHFGGRHRLWRSCTVSKYWHFLNILYSLWKYMAHKCTMRLTVSLPGGHYMLSKRTRMCCSRRSFRLDILSIRGQYQVE